MSSTRHKKIKKIHVIINPASGKIQPILPTINTVLKEGNVDWDVSITKKPHDAAEQAKDAVKRGVDAVAVYGGDGTVMETVSGMIGSDVPLAILPGGTANVMASDLKISKELKEACELICAKVPHTKAIDVGEFNKRYFLMRLGLGFEAEMVKGADRKIKNSFGMLAYFLSSASAVKKIKEVKYHVKIDGKEHEASGITCIVANTGSMGIGDLTLDTAIDVSDGLLDVIIVRHLHLNLFKHALAILLHQKRPNDRELVQHWQGKEIHVKTTPPQVLQCDGEILDKIPIHAKIIPGACRIIVPPEDEAPAKS